MVDLIGSSFQPAASSALLGTQFQLATRVLASAIEVSTTLPDILLDSSALGNLVDVVA